MREHERRDIDPYQDRPNDLRLLSNAEDWHVAEGEPDIRGWRLLNRDGDDIGVVRDLLISTSASLAIFAVCRLKDHDKDILVPLDKAEINLKDHVVTYKAGRDEIEGAPEYSADTKDFGEYYDYWSHEHERRPEGSDRSVQTQSRPATHEGDIRGWHMFDRDGNDIGTIDDMMTSSGGHDKDLAVVSHSMAGGAKAEQVLVPVSRIKTDAENHRVVFDGTMDDLAGALRLPGSQERSEAPPREQGTEAPSEERHETRRHHVRVVRQGVETEHEMKPGQQHPLAAETFEVPVAQQKMVVERGAETGEIVIRSEVVQAQPEAQHGERVKVKDQEMEDEEEDRPEGSL